MKRIREQETEVTKVEVAEPPITFLEAAKIKLRPGLVTVGTPLLTDILK